MSGTVTFEGRPVDRGSIQLTSVDEKTGKMNTMNTVYGAIEKGKYSMTRLQPGKYSVTFEGTSLDNGYEGDKDPKTSTIDVTEEKKQKHDFNLKKG